MIGQHTLKSWSKTQSLLARSSAEAELYAALKASAESLGILSILTDFGICTTGGTYGDAPAALGIIHRKGLGRPRYIDIGLLWIQKAAAEHRLEYLKLLGNDNPADLMMKHRFFELIERPCHTLGIGFLDGRALAAPKLSSLVVHWELESGHDDNDDDEHMTKDCATATIDAMYYEQCRQTMKNRLDAPARKYFSGSELEDPEKEKTTSCKAYPNAILQKGNGISMSGGKASVTMWTPSAGGEAAKLLHIGKTLQKAPAMANAIVSAQPLSGRIRLEVANPAKVPADLGTCGAKAKPNSAANESGFEKASKEYTSIDLGGGLRQKEAKWLK